MTSDFALIAFTVAAIVIATAVSSYSRFHVFGSCGS